MAIYIEVTGSSYTVTVVSNMMRTIKEILLLTIASTAIAVVANSVRANPAIKGHLSWDKDYFKRAVLTDSTPVDTTTTPATPQANPVVQEPHIKHDFQPITHKDVAALLDDPNTHANLNIFVDARNDEAYEKGHIPGAIQADHYELDYYVENLLQFAPSADKIVVYCNGGSCEDSVLMCQDLLELGIDKSVIYLYEGGWKAWEASGAPIETGR